MSSPQPYETELLASAEAALSAVITGHSASFELRLQVLEATASLLGGFSLADFHRRFGVKPLRSGNELLAAAGKVVAELRSLPYPAALGLCALAREPLTSHAQRAKGAYYTDFRLAQSVARRISGNLTTASRVADPAAGAGILLAAMATELCGRDKKKAAKWFRHGVVAFDTSPTALRGALLALASFSDDLDALSAMRARWRVTDSLMAAPEVWEGVAPGGFDAVIANPPWEKVKITRHEFLKGQGNERHYGQAVANLNKSAYESARQASATYSSELAERYPVLKSGEPDLYAAFLELYLRVLRPGGVFAVLVPGGIIRSQGTEGLRKKIFAECSNISVSLFDNKARFFGIDTRFKFVALCATKQPPAKPAADPVTLRHESGAPLGTHGGGAVKISRSQLSWTRPDLSVPEVRSSEEWQLYLKVLKAGTPWEDKKWGWEAAFCREVDMTRDKGEFVGPDAENALPLIEGRMVQQHRFGAKGYVSGSGRKAIWNQFSFGQSRVVPQFMVRSSALRGRAPELVTKLRAGFCDITGQTNERTMMAALIPPGVVCGNKVPTISFLHDQSEERLLAWVSVMNSFVFDWMLRRVVTTTVNYFLLVSVPLPKLVKGGLPWTVIVSAAREIRALDSGGTNPHKLRKMAGLRATIDAEIASAYGLNLDDLTLVMQDFPLLDRGQPAMRNEARSTVTRDQILATFSARSGRVNSEWASRCNAAKSMGAIGYLSSDASVDDSETNQQEHAS